MEVLLAAFFVGLLAVMVFEPITCWILDAFNSLASKAIKKHNEISKD